MPTIRNDTGGEPDPRKIELTFTVKVTVERGTDEPRSLEQVRDMALLTLESAAKGIHRESWDDLKYQLVSVEVVEP